MNHEPHDDAKEREWALQEQAFKAERLVLGAADNTKLERYRTVMRALRQPMDDELAPDFAHNVAASVMQCDDMKLELYASWALLAVLAMMLLGVLVRYSAVWMRLASNPWLVALAACVALSGLLGKLWPEHAASRG
ncbi:hypothetical protein DWU98_01795 [Dyella monticola]|uniref:Uncharacterized protein n=1 Tax=Dyella monticola TaxID=1927958 RepID=A0A370X8X9_9GAMM|nr:hypothetical protein [Dyella monticola]RDS84720.1 hypothetical protein DWU98_01795 [Dyella monticola]